MLWAFDYLYSWIKARGRQDDNPFGIICDEFAHMTQKVVDATNPLAQDLDTFINVYMRQHTIWFTAAHQELYQIDEQLRNTLLSLGTYILGGTSSMESARTLADALFSRDPWWIKYWRPVYGRRYSHSPLEVIAEEPEFMNLEEQTEFFAQRIKKLGRLQFLLRPALAEGHIGSEVLPLTIHDLDRDKETGEYQFPDIPLMQRLRTALAKHSGTPIARLLQEQEKRLPQALPQRAVPYTLPQPSRRRPQPRQRTSDIQTFPQRHSGAQPDMARTAPDQASPHPPLQRRHRLSSDRNERR
jgi:hypothetical protein